MYTGKVIDGRVVVDGTRLPEGADVIVVLRGDCDAQLTAEEEAELEAAIEEVERGEFVDGEIVLQRLRNGEYGRTPVSRRSSR